MQIPSYQIHNILKDFTQQLKKWHRHNAAAAGRQNLLSGPGSGPNDLRRAAVVSKVADKIMKRIASLGQEAEPAAKTKRLSREPDEGFDAAPAAFDYHLLDPAKGKVKQRLVVKDSLQLVQRLQSLTAAEEENGRDAP